MPKCRAITQRLDLFGWENPTHSKTSLHIGAHKTERAFGHRW